MQEIKFKTNIKCGGCIATVTPYLNSIDHIDSWSVDITVPDKILTVSSDQDVRTEVIEKIQEAGYKITILR